MFANSYAVAVAATAVTLTAHDFPPPATSRNRSIDDAARSLPFCRTRARLYSSLRRPRAAPYSTLRTRIRAYNIRQHRILLRRSVTHTHTYTFTILDARTPARTAVRSKALCIPAGGSNTDVRKRAKASALS